MGATYLCYPEEDHRAWECHHPCPLPLRPSTYRVADLLALEYRCPCLLHTRESIDSQDTRMNDSSPSSTGLPVGATFLEVWPSLGCRRGRYTSFRCSGCSSRYFSFFLIMLSSSTFKSLSLFWSESESDAVEESFSISSSRSGAHFNLQVLWECVKHTPCVLFHQGEVSGLLPLCLVLLQIMM